MWTLYDRKLIWQAGKVLYKTQWSKVTSKKTKREVIEKRRELNGVRKKHLYEYKIERV